MKKTNTYNPRIPYFIMYRKGGWVFYNREYKAAVNVHAPINAPITASSSDATKLEALTAELSHANALLAANRQLLSEREQIIKEKERLIQLLLKQ